MFICNLLAVQDVLFIQTEKQQVYEEIANILTLVATFYLLSSSWFCLLDATVFKKKIYHQCWSSVVRRTTEQKSSTVPSDESSTV